MLYPKRTDTLTPHMFQNPTCEYRATPFWAWNNKLDADELKWQIEQFKEMGFGGFHMHVRTGLATEYLSDEYMSIIKACVDKARDEDMLAWLYDEDRWPSGAAGGIVTKNPKFRAMHLLLTRNSYEDENKSYQDETRRAIGKRTEKGKLLACYDITLSDDGRLASYKKITPGDPAQGFKLFAYEETILPDPWFNNETYLNALDSASVAEFIRVTYERYKETVSEYFGGVIPAIFTDEPQFTHKSTLNFAHERKDVSLPWTFDLLDSFKREYNDDLLPNLPELLWDLPDDVVSLARYRYHDHVAERFAAAFADQCGDWCEKNSLMLTGHMMEEPTLESQTAALGDTMRSYRSFQLPGIDMLCDFREYTTAKQAQSAARQYGRAGVLSELYGVTNYDFDFREHKLQGDWQAALGVTVRVPHLSWVSMNGEAKRDYPQTFNYQSPWYKEYPYIEDHFARLSTILTRGKAVCRVGVIHPVESYWLHWGVQETTAAIREQMDKDFLHLTDWLLRGCIDFDFISESLLPDQFDTQRITKDSFPVGEMSYEVVIVPNLLTIRETTLISLEVFKNAGGNVIFTGSVPSLVDAKPDYRASDLYNKCKQVPFERISLLKTLEDLRDLEIRSSSGAVSENLLYQLREEQDCRWLFIAQADKSARKDIPDEDTILIKIRGCHTVTLYDTMTGETKPLASDIKNDRTVFSYHIHEHDSLLLRLDYLTSSNASVDNDVLDTKLSDGKFSVNDPLICSNVSERDREVFLTPVPVTLSEPNVLLLDMSEYSLDDEPYRSMEEILRLDNILRSELGWPLRSSAVAQPWVESDTSTPYKVRLRYKFESEIEIKDTLLALENAAITDVHLNGQTAGSAVGWYVDKCISTVTLPKIKQGENILELTTPYGKKIDLEACYLLGDFGVSVRGVICTLTKPVRELCFGDITRQGLPFYGGNITYHLDVETKTDTLEIAASYYRGHLLRASVDGADAGVIAFAPYRLKVENLKPGKHRIDLTYFGSRINTFGQLHNNDRFDGQWWGPNSWRSTGPAWTYEYRFWEQGVLKSPEVI